jgi:hypothetical protein
MRVKGARQALKSKKTKQEARASPALQIDAFQRERG